MTEKEKMLAGELYDPSDSVLRIERQRARDLCLRFNGTAETEQGTRAAIISELLGYESTVSIQPPFYCDYGTNITLGRNVYFNFNCIVLDVMSVYIGDNTLFGPSVQIYTATHPTAADTRRSGLEFAKPIVIGADVWVGGAAVVCPGVTIGARTVIGAGSVVTRDIPDDVLAAGNPCRPIRSLLEGH